MIPATQLPVPPELPTTTTWGSFKTRLETWVLQVSQAFSSQFLQQVPVVGATAAPFTSGTVPYRIDAASDGTARAFLVADGQPLFFVTGVPGVLQWGMTVGANATTVTLGTPASLAWFAFLVAR